MENFFATIFTGVSGVAGKLLGHPLDFLAGKSCNTKCKPAWDFICYIENFCVSLLIKSAMVIVLLYFVLLFLYLTYKLGICQCMCHTICKSLQTCFGMCFSMLECCCNFCCLKIHNHNQRRRQRKLRDIEAIIDEDELDYKDMNFSSQYKEVIGFRHQSRRFHSHRRHLDKDESMKKALRPRSHRTGVRIDPYYLHNKKSIRGGDHIRPGDRVRVTRSSKFSQKRPSFKASLHHRRRKRK